MECGNGNGCSALSPMYTLSWGGAHGRGLDLLAVAVVGHGGGNPQLDGALRMSCREEVDGGGDDGDEAAQA